MVKNKFSNLHARKFKGRNVLEIPAAIGSTIFVF
jgi:hypothetical protein